MAKKKATHGGRRPGAGPPRQMAERSRLDISLEAATRQQLEQLAEAEGVSLAAIVRRVIDAGLASIAKRRKK